MVEACSVVLSTFLSCPEVLAAHMEINEAESRSTLQRWDADWWRGVIMHNMTYIITLEQLGHCERRSGSPGVEKEESCDGFLHREPKIEIEGKGRLDTARYD